MPAAARGLVFFCLALGLGMLIHGVNWMVLAWLENHSGEHSGTPVRASFWHGWRIFIQVPFAPVKMVVELIWTLGAPGVVALTMEENTPEIGDDKISMFSFIQDFYLYFSQFYAHTAYALLLGLPCFAVYAAKSHTPFLGPFIALWLMTGLMFITGRVQFASMCIAERRLAGDTVELHRKPRVGGWLSRARGWLFDGWGLHTDGN